MIDGLLVCDKCQNTVKLILTLIAQFVMWYKKNITEQSFKRFICKSPPLPQTQCWILFAYCHVDQHWWLFTDISGSPLGYMVQLYFPTSFEVEHHPLLTLAYGMWVERLLLEFMRLVRNSPHFFPPAWWLPCFKLWGFHHLE